MSVKFAGAVHASLPGIDFIKLHFGQKVFSQFFIFQADKISVQQQFVELQLTTVHQTPVC
jgi:hypothetical protein